VAQGRYIFKLLAVDVPTVDGPEQRVFLAGDEAVYNRGAHPPRRARRACPPVHRPPDTPVSARAPGRQADACKWSRGSRSRTATCTILKGVCRRRHARRRVMQAAPAVEPRRGQGEGNPRLGLEHTIKPGSGSGTRAQETCCASCAICSCTRWCCARRTSARSGLGHTIEQGCARR